jgi:hypothetical protein
MTCGQQCRARDECMCVNGHIVNCTMSQTRPKLAREMAMHSAKLTWKKLIAMLKKVVLTPTARVHTMTHSSITMQMPIKTLTATPFPFGRARLAVRAEFVEIWQAGTARVVGLRVPERPAARVVAAALLGWHAQRENE